MHTPEVSTNVCFLYVSHSTFGFGFSAGGIAYSNAFFGAGTGPIYLDDVACTSSASQLLECSSRPILTHNCRHTADAGVGCEGSPTQVYYIVAIGYIYICIYEGCLLHIIICNNRL